MTLLSRFAKRKLITKIRELVKETLADSEISIKAEGSPVKPNEVVIRVELKKKLG